MARLFATWDVLPQGTLARRIRRRLSGYRYQGAQPDPQDPGRPLAPGDWFLNCHVTEQAGRPRVVPIMHFKFTADLGRKIEYALRPAATTRARAAISSRHPIDRMMQSEAVFTSKVSLKYASWKDRDERGMRGDTII